MVAYGGGFLSAENPNLFRWAGCLLFSSVEDLIQLLRLLDMHGDSSPTHLSLAVWKSK